MILRKFRDGLLQGTFMSAAGQQDQGGGGGGGGPANAAFLGSLPEGIRGHDAFKEVKDVGDLATRYHGELSRPFLERVPESLRNEVYFKDIDSVDKLATKAFNQAKMIGRDPNTLLVIPDGKDEKAMGEMWNRLGRPETAEKYEIPAKRADGKEYSDDDRAFQKGITPLLHEAGITQGQLAKLMPKWDQLMDAMTAGATAKEQESFKTAETKLRGEWGAAYEDNLGLADGAIAHLTKELKLDGLNAELNRNNLGNNPALFRIFAHLGKQLKEDGLIGKDTGGHGGGMTPDQAKIEIKKLESEEAWQKQDHPQHADAIKRRSELYSMAYPGGQGQ